MKILAVSGSLRDRSSNLILLEAAALLAPDGVEIVFCKNISELPHFNPDLDTPETGPPFSVVAWREQVKAADGILISSPEYAHGVPGSLKNALDWLVSSGETIGKPFALLNASPRSIHAPAQLAEILQTMAAMIITEASVTISLPGKNLNAMEVAANAELSNSLREAVTKFVRAIKRKAN